MTYSTHYFIYPFTSEKKINITGVENSNWEEVKYDFNSDLYKQLVYFNDEGRKLLFSNDIVAKYRYSKLGKAKMCFAPNDYELSIKNVLLHSFNNSIYLFIIEAENQKYSDINIIKKINDFGRRLYVPFDGAEKNGLCFEKITLSLDEEYSLNLKEKYNNNKIDNENLLSSINEYLIPDFVVKLLNLNDNVKKYNISSLVDERMLIISHINSGYVPNLDGLERFDTQAYQEMYKLAFCDGGYLTYQNEAKLKDEVSKYLYDRWKDYNSLYFISENGFITVENSSGGSSYLEDNVCNLYAKMYYLTIMQKMAVLHLHHELNTYGWKKNPADAYDEYNKINLFTSIKIVSTQIQAIEMYDMMREKFKIDEYMLEISSKINQIHLYKSEQNAKKNTEAGLWIAIILAVIALLTSAIDFFEIASWKCSRIVRLIVAGSLFILSIFTVIIRAIQYFKNKKGE